MPRGVYTDIVCKKWHTKFTPQEHQEYVKDYFINSKNKGLLLYHRLGSGKSCSSIIIGDALLKLPSDSKIKKVYILSPGSLRQNWISEYCGVCGESKKMLTDRYTFITYNYAVAKSLPKRFDNSLVIIDEVHNLINGVKNQAQNVTEIYNKLMKSNCKILALSGTPIYNNIYEWALLGNLLKPGSMPNIIQHGSLHSNLFMNLFDISQDGIVTPRDPQKFNAAVSGIISYFPGVGGGMYPVKIEEPIIKVPMARAQEEKYWTLFKREQKFLAMGMPSARLRFSNPTAYEFRKNMYILSKKRILSRQPSNFYYPPNLYSKVIIETSDEDGTEEEEVNEFIRAKDAVYPEGWVERSYFNHGQLKNEYSPKMAKLFNNILNNFNSKHMVFSFFKEHSGVNIMRAMFEMCGVRTETFSGDLSDKGREKLLKEFNSVANRYGDIIKVIFVTDAGAEGITLLETGHVHILESDPRENKIQQAIGRVVRYKSHINMPKNLQNVHIWRYWSVSENPEFTGKTIDELLYEQWQVKMNTFNSFMDLLINNSI